MLRLRSSLAVAALAGAAFAAAPAARAQSAYDYPWCAVYGDNNGPGAMSCYYATRELCLQTLSGIGGTCVRSPFYGQGPRREGAPRRARGDY